MHWHLTCQLMALWTWKQIERNSCKIYNFIYKSNQLIKPGPKSLLGLWLRDALAQQKTFQDWIWKRIDWIIDSAGAVLLNFSFLFIRKREITCWKYLTIRFMLIESLKLLLSVLKVSPKEFQQILFLTDLNISIIYNKEGVQILIISRLPVENIHKCFQRRQL